MLRRLALVLALLAAALPAAAQESGPAEAIAGVISDQLAHFNERDVAGAFEHASPTIKGIFGNPANFGMMVQRGYPMVWTNSGARYLDLRERGGAWYQLVEIEDATGGLHLLEYKMIETGEGWQIDGVRILPAPDLGV